MSDTTLAVAVAALVLVAYAAFVVTAVVQVVRSAVIARSSKLVWLVALVFVPLLGSVAWFLVGDRTPQLEAALRAAGR